MTPRSMETSGEARTIVAGRFQKHQVREVREAKGMLAALAELVDCPKHVVAVGLYVDGCPDLPNHAVRVDQERMTRGQLCYAEIQHGIVFSGHVTFRVGQ